MVVAPFRRHLWAPLCCSRKAGCRHPGGGPPYVFLARFAGTMLWPWGAPRDLNFLDALWSSLGKTQLWLVAGSHAGLALAPSHAGLALAPSAHVPPGRMVPHSVPDQVPARHMQDSYCPPMGLVATSSRVCRTFATIQGWLPSMHHDHAGERPRRFDAGLPLPA